MTRPYYEWDDPNRGVEYFGNSFLLVCANRLAAGFMSGLIILFKGDFSEFGNKAPLYKYAAISVSNVIATSCQYEALKWVTFPTQTLAKSAKAIPVMIWGSLIAGKVYGIPEYLSAIAVGMGCAIFMLFGRIAATTASTTDCLFGLALMGTYLFFDGFTSTFQEKLFAGYSMSIHNQMMYVSFSSACLSLLVVFVTGTAASSLSMLQRHPQLVSDMTALSLAAASGQLAISFTIKHFGALIYATIMTVRQFFSVFVSNIVFQHGMNGMQWGGASIVFAALLGKCFVKSREKKAPDVNMDDNPRVLLTASPPNASGPEQASIPPDESGDPQEPRKNKNPTRPDRGPKMHP